MSVSDQYQVSAGTQSSGNSNSRWCISNRKKFISNIRDIFINLCFTASRDELVRNFSLVVSTIPKPREKEG